MSTYSRITTVPNWTTTVEVASFQEDDSLVLSSTAINVEPDAKFLIAVTSQKMDFSFLDLATITELGTPNGSLVSGNLSSGDDYYVDPTLSLALIINPPVGLTTFTFPQLDNSNAPRYGMLSAFYGNVLFPITSTAPASSKPIISWKCAACKTAAAGLAAAIVGASIHFIIPAALTAAVVAFLSAHVHIAVTTAAANTFIKAMYGAPISYVLDALCVKVGLCP